jgi:excisionase family DNA binding protein
MATHTDWIDDALSHLPPVCTATEALGVLRCSRRELYRRVADGRLPAVKAREGGSSRLLIPRSALRAYLAGLDAR